jgi:hypothetical protein
VSTKTASAKSVAKQGHHQAMSSHPAMAAAKQPAKDQSKIASNAASKPQKVAAKKAASKGKKVKVADAEARK